MKSKHLVLIYFLVLVLEMIGDIVFDMKALPYGIWIFKPFLMPILMFWFYKETKMQSSFDKIIMASLFFSWWGDNFLMPMIFKTDINFLLGLASFLIAHVLYIVAFMKSKVQAASILKTKPYLALIFVLYGYILLKKLFTADVPGFQEMSIPVIVYASVIMIMVISAINRYGKVSQVSFRWVLLGALMFMASDSFIALSRFTNIFADGQMYARLLIMPLYAIGQYFIIKGCILQNEEE